MCFGIYSFIAVYGSSYNFPIYRFCFSEEASRCLRVCYIHTTFQDFICKRERLFSELLKEKKRFCLPQNSRCDGADQSTTCITRSCFSRFRESSSSPTWIITPAEKPQTWETLWLTKATWGGAEKKQLLITGLDMQSCYQNTHATISKHKACQVACLLLAYVTLTAWHSLPSAANLRTRAQEPADPPWAAQPGSWHGTQLGAHLKSWTQTAPE